jgi:hypothetical protein
MEEEKGTESKKAVNLSGMKRETSQSINASDTYSQDSNENSIDEGLLVEETDETKVDHFDDSHASSALRHTFADFRRDPVKMKTKSVLYIILSLLGVAYACIAFTTSYRAYKAIGKHPLVLRSLIHNWELTPIIDI